MSSSITRSDTTPRTRRVTGALALTAGAILAVSGMASGADAGEAAPVQTVPLNNDEALVQENCPDDIGDYWHFIIAPNPDGFAFVEITLVLDDPTVADGDDTTADDTTFTFSGSDIIQNGDQPDNVFVEVPDGYGFGDIVKLGSSADITPASPAVKFVLSHLCDGSGTTTTTTVVEEETTTTTVVEEETTTTVVEEETTTTVVEEESTTTTVATEESTTTVQLASQGPTTTQAASAGGVSTPVTELPKTGGDLNRSLGVAGALLLLVGGLLLLTTRRTTAE